MNKQLQRIMAIIYLAAVFIPAALSATNVYDVKADGTVLNATIQPDPTSLKDTMIQSAHTPTQYGSETSIGVGEDNADTNIYSSLIEFDLTTLPANITLVSATLSIWVREDHSDNARTMRAYPILAPWNENLVGWTSDGYGAEFGNVNLADNLVDSDKVDMTLDPFVMSNMVKQNYYGFRLEMDTPSDDLYLFYSSDETAHPEYRPMLYIEYTIGDFPPLDNIGWLCMDAGLDIANMNCGTSSTTVPSVPAIDIVGISGPVDVPNIAAYGSYPAIGRGLTSVRIVCDPYPNCKNDYPIFYKIEYSTSWNARFGSQTNPFIRSTIRIPGGTDIDLENHDCGSAGMSGACSGVMYGIIPVDSIGTGNEITPYNVPDIAVLFMMMDPVGQSIFTTHFTVSFSLMPFGDSCSSSYVVPVPEAYTIDPTIETPVGDPLDHQIYTTTVGVIYMVRVADGPWNDGSADHYDASVSTDGIFWHTMEEFSAFPNVLCVDTDPYNPDMYIIYFTAETDEFHIRANDVPTEFADNTNNLDTPFQYKIGIAFELANAAACETQFSYDTGDALASVVVHSNDDDVQATTATTQPLDPGGWYAIEVDSGTWNEAGGPDRIDMEYEFAGGIGGTAWTDLADASDLVWCVSTDGKTVFIQAPTNPLIELHLRVNDQDANFANNTGTLNVNIYHATFTRIVTGCELQFDIDGLLLHDSVDGNQSGGKAFGKYPTDLDLLTLNGQPVLSVYTGDQFLLPGAWYALDTVLGPWVTTTTFGDRTANTPYYDMEIKVGDDDWTDLATWSGAQCIVPTDSLGHVRVYFQVPDDTTMGDKSYLLRVASNAFMFTRGSEAFDLYGAVDYGYSGSTGDCSSYKYDPNAPKQIGQVNSALETGSYISGLGTGGVFAIQVESADSGWHESSGAGESDGLQISVDGGVTWDILPDSPAVLCSFLTPVANELVFFIRVQNGQQWKLRADSSTFSNNIGFEDYTVYEASPGGDVNLWTSCIKDYPLAAPAINPHQWIDVEKSEGQLITSLAQYAEYNGLLPEGAQLPPEIWKDPNASGYYVIEIEYGTGPWKDGETPSQHYNAQLSKDDGATWETLNADSTIVVCSTVDQLRQYWKALLHVTDGEVWKIRVADTDTSTFSDNTGSLGYKLYTAGGFEVPPADNSNIGYISVQGGGDVCEIEPVSPGSLDFTDIDALGTYVGDWISYANLAIERYMSFCPRHVDMFFSIFDLLKKKEPFATMAEFGTMEEDIKRELKSYGWQGEGQDLSFIWGTKSSQQIQSIVDTYVTSDGGGDPWAEGAQLVDLHSRPLPSSYAACIALLPEYKRFAEGLCFASSMMKETSAQFWIQLSFDVSMMILVFQIVGKGIMSVIGMATGTAIVNTTLDVKK